MMNKNLLILLILSCFEMLTLVSCNNKGSQKMEAQSTKAYNLESNPKLSKAVFASGCFWCVEAVFESVVGVSEAISGYAGGTAAQANYGDVSNGITDHAEAVLVLYDAEKVSYATLLKVFYGSHDATTLNRQGPDGGRQYRSEIFYINDDQKQEAEKYTQGLYNSGAYKSGSITTLISALPAFYAAEDYHQDYERKNPNQPYVRSVSVPRLNKFKAAYPELLKPASMKH